MADVNYINPSAILPKQGYQPTGFLGGMQYSQQMRDYEDMMSLSKLMSQMGAQKEMEDMTLGAPVRASKRAADIASNQTTARTVGPMADANLGILQDRAQVSRAGVPAQIRVQAAEALSKMGAEGYKQIKQQIQTAQTVGAIMQQNGPAGAAMVQRMAEQQGWDPALVGAAMKDPQKVTQLLMSIDQELQGKLVDQEAKDKAAMARAKYVADSQARSQRYTADKAYERATAEKPAQAPRSTDQFLAQQAEQMVKALVAKGVPPDKARALVAQKVAQQRVTERAASTLQGQAGGASIGLPETPGISAPPFSPIVSKGLTSAQQADWVRQAKLANPSLSEEDIKIKGIEMGYLDGFH